MATTAAVARNLLKNSRSLPQILRGQILGRSNVTPNLNNIAKDHQIVQPLFVSNQQIHAQIPIFDFPEMGSLGSYGGLSLAEKGVGHGMGGLVFEARGKGVVKDEDDDSDNEFDDDDDDDDDVFDDDFDGEFVDDDDDDDDEDDDEGDDDGKFDGAKYKNKF